ncbi:MAG: hypothetical protein AAF724_15640 [Pseudomonadota bacterium]
MRMHLKPMIKRTKPTRPRGRKAECDATDPIRDDKPSSQAMPIIRDAVIRVAIEAGEGDMVAYLKKQAETHPSAFLTLLGKVMPMQLIGGLGEPVNLQFSVHFVAGDGTQELAANDRPPDKHQ